MTEAELMRRALELARLPKWTSPNPRVGCVIARDGAVISEGHHDGSGTAHAETVALRGVDAKGATLFVNLEPCVHTGKTPPCVPQIIAAGIAQVVVAHLDPDPRVNGRGAQILKDSGIEVEVGLLADEAKRLNAPYLHHRSTGRSFLTLKLAMSLDGRLSAPDGSSRWITGQASRDRVQARRAEADAVMVGAGTVIADDPSLTARPVAELRQPLRVIVDGRGSVSPGARTLGLPGDVLIVTTGDASQEKQTAWKEAGAEVLPFPTSDGTVPLIALLSELGRRSVVEVICEGGGTLATQILKDEMADRLEFYVGPVVLGSGGAEIGSLGIEAIGEGKRFRLEHTERLEDDVLVVLGRSA